MKVARQWRPPTVEPAESEEEPTEGEEEPTEGGEESTEGEGGSTAAAAQWGRLGRPPTVEPAEGEEEPTEGEEEPTEGVEEPTATTPMEAIVHPGCVRPKMDLTHRPRTTMIKIEDSNYRTMVSSHGAGRVLQTINKHVITFRNTKSVKTKPLR